MFHINPKNPSFTLLQNLAQSSMAEIQSVILTAMDRLWFHQIILLSEPISVICSKSINLSSPISSQSSTSSSNASQLEEDEDKASANCPSCSVSQDDCNNEVEEVDKEAMNEVEVKPITRSQNQIINKIESPKPPSRPFHRSSRSLNYYDDIQKCLKLPRTSSCKTSYDHLIEQQEVQGFMDLGFQFEKDQLTPRTMSVVPGLQRIGGGHKCNLSHDHYGTSSLDEGRERERERENEEEKKGASMQPYLSEAWEVKKPNSPLLRLRMARVNTAEDMKKCLKLWAKTVAFSISDT